MKEFAAKSVEKCLATLPKENLSVNSGQFQDNTVSKDSYRAYQNDELKESRQAQTIRTHVVQSSGKMDATTMHKVNTK